MCIRDRGEAMEATITLELTYIMIEVDGVQLLEVDKLNGCLLYTSSRRM